MSPKRNDNLFLVKIQFHVRLLDDEHKGSIA